MSIEDELKKAGMLTVKELIDGQPADGFIVHAGVTDIDKFSEWLNMRSEEMLKMKARMLLDKNDDGDFDDDGDLWVGTKEGIDKLDVKLYNQTKKINIKIKRI